MRRMLSTTVIVHTAPTQEQLLLSDAPTMVLYTPTESEMRDAIALCTKELNEMFEARGYSGSGWKVEKFDFKPVLSPDRDVLLMGAMIIERLD